MRRTITQRTAIAFAIGMAFLAATTRAASNAPAAVAAAVPGCDAMDVGPVYDASLDAGAALACFQLVVPASSVKTKLDVNFAGFDPATQHDVSLVRVGPDGSTHVIASNSSADPFRVIQATNAASTRWLVLVGRPATGPMSPFQFQATLAYGSDRYEPNDSIAKSTVLQGNQQLQANLDSTGDVDHYLISFRAEQKKTLVEFEAAAGVIAELIDEANQQHVLEPGQSVSANSSRPIFISVRGTEAVKAGARYTLRTRDPSAFAVVSRVYSKENISHLAPGLGLRVPGGANAARTLEVEATVYEGDRTTTVGPGQRVLFNAFDLESKSSHKWLLTATEAVTDDNGVARATLNIGPCKGGILGPIRVPTRGGPPDFWDIAYNPTSAVVATVPGNEQPTGPSLKRPSKEFQHVCKETFRRGRP